ncbi:probable metal-nicotianamine transporter YSL7 isoform X2 [Malus sylvestris]|uniref:probable metal-nicotianamine transporter YSL7 isoform X2 n=1 Tax=Malus sylvestris TaxID=3752 RepID=UPI0021ABB2BC|nr:probable metal-nicotianamine transporter YSL7 isoform X2 [Malus sylvestris]
MERSLSKGSDNQSDDLDAKKGTAGKTKKKLNVEEAFKATAVPPWTKQITVRSMVTSFILSIVFNFIVCKLNLTTGVIPSLNVAAGLLGFAVVKGYTAMIDKCGFLKQPFTRQENTVIQTCVVASSGIAFSSGTASYLLGMSAKIAAQGDLGNTPINIKKLDVGWMIGFLFAVSFVGLFSIMPLRKMMILKYKLTYPSGTATAYLINSFHTPKGAKLAKKQVAVLFKSFCFSFAFAFFQWFFAAADGCGFSSFPTFGLKAFANKFYFDFSATYVGVGMICPIMVNVSLLVGAIISWGIMWPLIETKKGIWYSANLSASSLHGIQGYRVFIAIAMMLGDGLFHVVYMLFMTTKSLATQRSEKKLESSSSPPVNLDSVEAGGSSEVVSANYDEQRRIEYFLKDQIPSWVAFSGYIVLAAISISVVPLIFPQLKWYHVLVAYLIAPVLAFCNAYGCGLTDWSLASNYGKFAIIIFSAWVGLDQGGVIAGLASCGVMMSIVATASDLMQDFKTGYLTLSSPRSMFFSQVFGTAMGCVMSPLVFWVFYKAYPLGDPDGPYPAPYGLMYRGIALLGVEGVGSLPKNCVVLAVSFFAAAVAINIIIELLQRYETKYRIYRFIPSPMCMAIPFYLGSYFAIDMCVGCLILVLWRRKNRQKADDFGPAVASGLICGDSLWGVPAAILAIASVKAPICMKFLSASANNKVNSLLGS